MGRLRQFGKTAGLEQGMAQTCGERGCCGEGRGAVRKCRMGVLRQGESQGNSGLEHQCETNKQNRNELSWSSWGQKLCHLLPILQPVGRGGEGPTHLNSSGSSNHSPENTEHQGIPDTSESLRAFGVP